MNIKPDLIPDFLSRRPAGHPVDHVSFARDTFGAELERTSEALKIIDLRMESTADEIAALQRQQAADRAEAEKLTLANTAARRALDTIDGVMP